MEPEIIETCNKPVDVPSTEHVPGGTANCFLRKGHEVARCQGMLFGPVTYHKADCPTEGAGCSGCGEEPDAIR